MPDCNHACFLQLVLVLCMICMCMPLGQCSQQRILHPASVEGNSGICGRAVSSVPCQRQREATQPNGSSVQDSQIQFLHIHQVNREEWHLSASGMALRGNKVPLLHSVFTTCNIFLRLHCTSGVHMQIINNTRKSDCLCFCVSHRIIIKATHHARSGLNFIPNYHVEC